MNPPYAVGSVETGLEIYKYTIYNIIYTAGKISIEHVTIFLSNNISKGAIDMTFSPDVGTTQVINTYTETNTNTFRN